MIEIMLDLETMGNNPRAAIIAIGAVSFDISEQRVKGEFYAPVALQSSVDAGLVMDPSTVLWWMQQSDEARAEFKGVDTSLDAALLAFGTWVADARSFYNQNDIPMWGNGAAFDNVILRSAYNACQMTPPWKYRDDRCYRTVRALHPDVEFGDHGTAHNAKDDAMAQALHLMKMLG